MTTLEFSRLIRRTCPHQAHGWTVSLLCHVLGVWGALLLMAEIEKPALPTTFHWEVAMVEAPAPVEPAPVQPAPNPPVPHPVERVEPRPLAKPIVPIQQATVVETIEPVQQTTQEVATPVETVLERLAPEADTRPVLTQAVSSRQEPVVEQAALQAAVSSIVERAEPIEERATIESVPQPKRSEAVQRASPPVESVSSTVEHRIVQQRLVRFRQTQADYGWLRDALWGRIEELKRYPTQAKANHWEGKVVVQAIIRDDGTVIGLQIAESSGRAILDQEAMAVMKKVSPLTLKHPLGKPQITILVPISYRLDG